MWEHSIRNRKEAVPSWIDIGVAGLLPNWRRYCVGLVSLGNRVSCNCVCRLRGYCCQGGYEGT